MRHDRMETKLDTLMAELRKITSQQAPQYQQTQQQQQHDSKPNQQRPDGGRRRGDFELDFPSPSNTSSQDYHSNKQHGNTTGGGGGRGISGLQNTSSRDRRRRDHTQPTRSPEQQKPQLQLHAQGRAEERPVVGVAINSTSSDERRQKEAGQGQGQPRRSGSPSA